RNVSGSRGDADVRRWRSAIFASSRLRVSGFPAPYVCASYPPRALLVQLRFRGLAQTLCPVTRRFSAVLLLLTFAAVGAGAAERPPNLVFILTDNQGAWTLGCYGNPDIRTPNIDRLATEGVRFTRALSSNPVCSPTRATFLTGLIPSQHGVHSFL